MIKGMTQAVVRARFSLTCAVHPKRACESAVFASVQKYTVRPPPNPSSAPPTRPQTPHAGFRQQTVARRGPRTAGLAPFATADPFPPRPRAQEEEEVEVAEEVAEAREREQSQAPFGLRPGSPVAAAEGASAAAAAPADEALAVAALATREP